MLVKLIGRTEPVVGREFSVGDVLRVGAAPSNDARISATGVSRNHARLWREGKGFWIEDAGSTNGTFLNGQRIQRDRLHHLDVVTLGRNVDLIFICRAGEQPEPRRSAFCPHRSPWAMDRMPAPASICRRAK